MPDPQWFTKQGPNGEWYKTQANSADEAIAKMSQAWGAAKQVGHTSQLPEASISTGRAPGPDLFGRETAIQNLEETLADIRYGGKRTWVGKGLSLIPGWHGTGGGLGDVASGPLTGVPEVALGVSRMFRPGQTIKGGLEAAGGLFTGTGLAGAAVEPEFLPTVARFTTFQEVASRIGQRLGLQPDTNNLISTILATAGTGATLDPRMRFNAIEAEKNAIRASRGFGAKTDEAMIQRAAEENVAKAEAQANTVKDIAKRSGQTVAQVVQSGAASTGIGGKGEELKQKFGSEVKTTKPIDPKPIPTPEEVQSKFLAAQKPPELQPKPEVKTRPVTQVEKVEQIAKGPTPEQELAQLRAQRAQEETDLRALVTERRALSPAAAKAWDAGVQEKPAVPEDATKLEKKQAAMKDRQQAVQAKEAEAAGFIVQHREANQLEETRLRQENVKLRNQSPVSPEVGRQAAPPEAAKPEPIQTQAPKGPGEPIRPAKEPEVAKGEPRSMRGDLGGRPPASGQLDFQKRIELQRQMVETMQADPRFKGVAKARLQEIANERIRKERGSFGGGGPDDVRARREAKINEWIKQLRDPKTDPASLDTAFKQLQAYGLDHNEIIRRVSGAEGFAKTPTEGLGDQALKMWGADRKLSDVELSEKLQRQALGGNLLREVIDPKKSLNWMRARLAQHGFNLDRVRDTEGPEKTAHFLNKHLDEITLRVTESGKIASAKFESGDQSPIEERLGPNPELDAKADSLIGGLMDTVDKVMGKSEENKRAEIHDEFEKLVTGFRQRQGREPNDLEEKQLYQAAEDSAGYRGSMSHIQATGTGQGMDLYRGEGLVAPSDREAFRKGEQDVRGVKSPDVEELERMIELKDQRGFWRMFPAKKAKPTGPGTGTALDDLTRNIEAGMKAIPPNDSRMKLSERLDKTLTEGWDKVQLSLGRIAAQSIALKDAYMRPPEQTDYHSSIGRFSGSLNRSAWELRQFTKNIKEMLPDERQREGITNWLQAAGDDQVLADRAARSKGSVRAGYERARNLTQAEIGYAKMIEAHFDRRLKEAIQLGVLDHGIENYVPQVWKPSDQQSMANHFSSLTRSGLLKPDFNSAKKRIFDSYFEGEQAGRKPVSKDIGFLVASWERAFNQAVASRNLIHDLSKGAASDGRPIVAPSGGVKTIYDPTSNTADPDVSAHLIYPKAAPDETGDYRAVNHPAMTKWNWVGKDPEGNPMFLKGDLRVHPEFAKKLDNIINRGKWAQEHPVQTVVLKGQGFFKATLLSMSPFHQIQEGTHAIFHNVNPLSPPGIDLTNPSLGKLLDRGLVIGNYDPVAAFDEGLTSGSGGAVGKIPGLGRFMQKYSDYLFSDYIPRLKAKMATEAYDRNMHRFQGALANGKITSDQIAEITAGQANAAFGELNYIMMGRHPQTQAIMRMMFLAPDFLEARVRFAGQALTPYGREQRVALLRGALGMYVTARVLNKLLDDDYHWDRKDAFSVVVHGYEYKIRSLPGDIWNLMQDSNGFLQHRLSFLPRAGIERISGKDDFGRRRDMGEQMMDFVRSVVPIPAQGFTKGDSGNIKQNVLSSVLSGAGITRSRYRTPAGAMAHQYAIGSNPTDATSHHISQMVQDITDGQFSGKHANEMIREGKMNPQDVVKAADLAALPEIWRDYRNLPVELKAKIWKVATPKERAILTVYSRRELDVTRLLPEQRAEFMKSFAKQ